MSKLKHVPGANQTKQRTTKRQACRYEKSLSDSESSSCVEIKQAALPELHFCYTPTLNSPCCIVLPGTVSSRYASSFSLMSWVAGIQQLGVVCSLFLCFSHSPLLSIATALENILALAVLRLRSTTTLCIISTRLSLWLSTRPALIWCTLLVLWLPSLAASGYHTLHIRPIFDVLVKSAHVASNFLVLMCCKGE